MLYVKSWDFYFVYCNSNCLLPKLTSYSYWMAYWYFNITSFLLTSPFVFSISGLSMSWSQEYVWLIDRSLNISSNIWKMQGQETKFLGRGERGSKRREVKEKWVWAMENNILSFIYLFHVLYGYFTCMCVCAPHSWLMPTDARRGHWIPWHWSYKCL